MINLVTLGEVKREQDSMRVEESTTGMCKEILFLLYCISSMFILTKAAFGGGSVAYWLGHWICNPDVLGSNPAPCH